MNISKLKRYDTANGFGVCTSLYVSGCSFHCEGCHNKEAWDFNYGQPYSEEVKKQILQMVKDENVDGFCLLGGEPLQQDLFIIEDLLKDIHKIGKPIHLWTGFKYEHVKYLDLMKYVTTVIDGQFEIDKRDIMLEHRGSSNQRVINVHA